MTYLVQPRLVNDAFSDPCLFLDFRFGKRAILFDIGDLSALAPREVARVSHVFVSHMHMDHFSGFDRLLRLKLYQPATLHLFGPPGLGDAVEAKLRAYTWNLLDEESADFGLRASEWSPQGYVRCSSFRARDAFARREIEPPRLAPGVLHEEADFQVQGAMLDHGIPCLAFALQEKLRINVHKAALDAAGLAVGPWLTEAKRAMRRGEGADATFEAAPGRAVTLGRLLEIGALRTGPGQRVAYATDLAFHPANASAAVDLARGADWLFIEAGFLDEDGAAAAAKRHLTAAQAGAIAREAGVARATPMHFSPRYAGREDELRNQFERAFAGGSDPASRSAQPLPGTWTDLLKERTGTIRAFSPGER